jgi:MEMO1 family protein
MIKSAFITPHSPILIPNIGKKNRSVLQRTVEAFSKIKEKIKEDKIDTIIILSSGKENKEIEINNHFQQDINFEKFGDYFSKISFSGDLELSYKIKEEASEEISLKANNKPNYRAAIPLYLLLSEENQRIMNFKGKVLIINSSWYKNLEDHYNFGKSISNLLEKEDKRIALIASAELSHSLTHRSPGGYYSKSEAFDNKLIELLKKKKEGLDSFFKLEEKNLEEIKECALRQTAMLSGIISDKEYKPETLSYQKDLGVGYLTMDMNI